MIECIAHISLPCRLTVGLSISLALLTIELISFLAGVSMFNAGISMICILLFQLHSNINISYELGGSYCSYL